MCIYFKWKAIYILYLYVHVTPQIVPMYIGGVYPNCDLITGKEMWLGVLLKTEGTGHYFIMLSFEVWFYFNHSGLQFEKCLLFCCGEVFTGKVLLKFVVITQIGQFCVLCFQVLWVESSQLFWTWIFLFGIFLAWSKLFHTLLSHLQIEDRDRSSLGSVAEQSVLSWPVHIHFFGGLSSKTWDVCQLWYV